jgi:hypothetical protein
MECQCVLPFLDKVPSWQTEKGVTCVARVGTTFFIPYSSKKEATDNSLFPFNWTHWLCCFTSLNSPKFNSVAQAMSARAAAKSSTTPRRAQAAAKLPPKSPPATAYTKLMARAASRTLKRVTPRRKDPSALGDAAPTPPPPAEATLQQQAAPTVSASRPRQPAPVAATPVPATRPAAFATPQPRLARRSAGVTAAPATAQVSGCIPEGRPAPLFHLTAVRHLSAGITASTSMKGCGGDTASQNGLCWWLMLLLWLRRGGEMWW